MTIPAHGPHGLAWSRLVSLGLTSISHGSLWHAIHLFHITANRDLIVRRAALPPSSCNKLCFAAWNTP